MNVFDASELCGVVVVCGHYGVGKTALSLSLARDAAAGGRHVSLVDLDVVNPYFRSSDARGALEGEGVAVVAPAFSGRSCNIDVPSITGTIVPAVESARAAGGLAVIDVGGDDAGAFALGRFSREIAKGPYHMFYVVNRYRALTQTPDQACEVLSGITEACRLKPSGIVNNSHLMGETTAQTVADSVPFATEVARAAGVPVAFHAVSSELLSREASLEGELAKTAPVYRMQPYRQTPWSC